MKTVKSVYIYVSTLCLILVLFVACNTGNEPEDSKKQLIPLAKGNSWSYVQTTFDTTGKASTAVYHVEDKVDSDTTIFNEKWYHSEGYPSNVWITNRSNGLWHFAKAGASPLIKRDTTILVFGYPAKIGTKPGTYEVVSVDKEVTVPAGTFRCIQYSYFIPNPTNSWYSGFEYFITPGLGIVKWQQVGKLSTGTNWVVYKSELTNYKVN
ncbi:MAG: hypothetical protein WCZ90_12760 [Melioribacteraceae bacterium]